MKNFIKTLIETLEGRLDKKIIFLILIIVVFSLSMAGSFAKEPLFSDVPQAHWAHDSIAKMHEEGIIVGYTDGSFKPTKDVTYGEFVKMLAVATAVARPKEDSLGKHWAWPFYHACLNNFHFTQWDISEKQFDMKISRKDMALAVSGALGQDVKIADYGNYGRLMESINDIDERHSHEFHMIKAYATGILTGYPDGSFRPDGVLTRAEAASVIERLGKLLKEIREGEGLEVTAEEEEEKETLQPGEGKSPQGPFREDLYDPVAITENPPGWPSGTLELLMFEYSLNTEKRKEALKQILEERLPDHGQAIFSVATEFAGRTVPMAKQAMRKEYFGPYPVMMEHIQDYVGIYILPTDYDDPYWGIRPGQIFDEVF